MCNILKPFLKPNKGFKCRCREGIWEADEERLVAICLAQFCYWRDYKTSNLAPRTSQCYWKEHKKVFQDHGQRIIAVCFYTITLRLCLSPSLSHTHPHTHTHTHILDTCTSWTHINTHTGTHTHTHPVQTHRQDTHAPAHQHWQELEMLATCHSHRDLMGMRHKSSRASHRLTQAHPCIPNPDYRIRWGTPWQLTPFHCLDI